MSLANPPTRSQCIHVPKEEDGSRGAPVSERSLRRHMVVKSHVPYPRVTLSYLLT